MTELAVFVRIGLYIISGRLMAGGWLPPELQVEIVGPAMVEAATGAVVAAGALAWYYFSKARAALRSAFR
ncbi:MAG: hypothetical protein ACRCWF_02995 [Beijerinckiaceae bacterium]